MTDTIAQDGYARQLDFAGALVEITSAPDGAGEHVDVSAILRNPEDFHGSPQVHDVVQFGTAFAGLIGHHDDPTGFFVDRDVLPEKGVIILADHYTEAQNVVTQVDSLAQRVINDDRLYHDVAFCRDYLAAARIGYGLLRQLLPDFGQGQAPSIALSLVRAGLVTTRLARGDDLNAVIDEEVRVVTKRAHPKHGAHSELMVTVKWEDPNDVAKLDDATVEMADFVNPASWASAAALLLSAQSRGAAPATLVHRSIMATEQGIIYARNVLLSGTLGRLVTPVFYTLGTSRNLSPDYYLSNPAVADAGHVLRHFLPDWYEQ